MQGVAVLNAEKKEDTAVDNQELTVQEQMPSPTVQSAESERLSNLQRTGKILVASGYFSDAREIAQAAVKVMAGEELGVPPVASMMGINIIKGKVAMSGNLIASRIKAHGYDFRITRHDSTGCVIAFRSKIEGGAREELGDASFTEDDAKKAGVFSDMYKKYPKNMYFNRAVSNGAKWFCPEVFSGMPIYTPEELGAKVDSDGEVVHEQPKPYVGVSKEEFVKQRVEEISTAPTPTPETQTASEVEPALAEKWKGMVDFAATVEIVGAHKHEIETATGSDISYYEILGRHGMEHANQLKGRGRKQMRLLVKDLHEFVAKVTAEPPLPTDGAPLTIQGTPMEASDAK